MAISAHSLVDFGLRMPALAVLLACLIGLCVSVNSEARPSVPLRVATRTAPADGGDGG
jgi:hypothetical protein